jgi:glycosyltransferase involved in cell wall biosynthesis
VKVQTRKKVKSFLYLSVYDPHVPLTGAGARGAEFVNNLAQRFNLDLVYLDGSGQPPLPDAAEKFACKIKGTRLKVHIDFSRFDYFFFSRSLYKEAKKLLKKNKYDFILCDYGLSAIYGILLSKKFKVPFIYCSHNIEHQAYLDKAKGDKRRFLLVPYVYWVERTGVKKSKILVAITDEDARYYTYWTNKDKMVVIPQGFDDSIFNPFYEPALNNTKIVLFCGNYNIQANREAVNIVMERILEKVLLVCPNAKFRFVGLNPPQDVKHPRVEFTGFVNDYPSYLKQADVVISPLQQGWGCPTKIIEALACGKPTIATPIGARSIERDYRNLSICEIDRFPEMICRASEKGKSVITEEFEKLRNRYSWRTNIQRLADKIEHEI